MLVVLISTLTGGCHDVQEGMMTGIAALNGAQQQTLQEQALFQQVIYRSVVWTGSPARSLETNVSTVLNNDRLLPI